MNAAFIGFSITCVCVLCVQHNNVTQSNFKNDCICAAYFVELSACDIPNVSNNVQTPKKSVILLKVTVHFIPSPVGNFRGNINQRVKLCSHRMQ